MKQMLKLLGTITAMVMLLVAQGRAGNLTVNGNLTVTTNLSVGTTTGVGSISVQNSSSDLILKLQDQRADASSSFLSKQAFYDFYSEAAYVGLRHNGGQGPSVRALVFGLNNANSGVSSEKMRITDGGAVGIGTQSPGAQLEVYQAATGITSVFGRGADGNFNINMLQDKSSNSDGLIGQLGLSYGTLANSAIRFHRGLACCDGFLSFTTGNNTEQVRIDKNGNVGIGTTNPTARLDIRPIAFTATQGGGVQLATTDGHWLSGMFLRSDAGAFPHLDFDGPGSVGALSITGSGLIGIGTYNPASALDVRGTTTTCVLTITGGCDLSEPFHMSSKDVPKGAIVTIDDEHPGELKLSGCAYDTRVAGIVSGANGVNPGISMSQQGVVEGGENVALSGRVYALADATNGSIKPGDLLTTSDTPGHCMKVTNHAKAQGAIIGKAMSSLQSGKGMVLVLVSLQ